MTDELTSARGLIAAYKACARPSAAGEAQLWATLAAADEVGTAGSRRPASRRAPWFAFAAGFLWARLSGRGAQAAVDAATALAALKCTIWGDIALVGRAELEELMASDSTEIRR